MVKLEAVCMSVVHTAAENPCGNSWSAVPLAVIGKGTTVAVVFTTPIDNRMRDIQSFCNNIATTPPPHTHTKSQDTKLL